VARMGRAGGALRQALPYACFGRIEDIKALKVRPGEFVDTLGSTRIHIHFNSAAESAYVTRDDGKPVPSLTTFWFAWQDFYPGTLVFADKQ
jgi:hypothetical protein